jgi:type II secretory pathway pseudopilin PulG
MRKYHFNMIEIILAISIISIGISSVMVLFTAGVKSSNATVQFTNLPDAAETAITVVRATASRYADKDGWKDGFDTEFPLLGSEKWSEVEAKNLAHFETKFKEKKSEQDGRTLISDDAGNYLYRQLRYTVHDPDNENNNRYESVFSAVIEARQVSQPAGAYTTADTKKDIIISDPILPGNKLADDKVKEIRDAFDGDAHSNLFKKVRRVLEVRISYPADVAPKQRESRIYRVELYNDKYDGI